MPALLISRGRYAWNWGQIMSQYRFRNFDRPLERVLRVAGLSLALMLAPGCGEGGNRYAPSDAAPAARYAGAIRAKVAMPAAEAQAPSAPAARGAKPGGQASETVPPATPRKIVYNARITLVVESMDPISDKLMNLVKDAGGYVSSTDQSGYTNTARTATWTVRVPVEKFDTFLAAVNRLGEVQTTHVDSQDVTQEYYDTEARIGNKEQEEKRLQKHLADSTGKLSDILEVEKELSRVRGEIETMKGRIRYLANVSDLSTVTITATEIQDFKPPVQPTFGTQIARTFAKSVESLVEFGKSIVLAVVSAAPWIPVVLVLAIPIAWLVSRIRAAWRRRRVVLSPAGQGQP